MSDLGLGKSMSNNNQRNRMDCRQTECKCGRDRRTSVRDLLRRNCRSSPQCERKADNVRKANLRGVKRISRPVLSQARMLRLMALPPLRATAAVIMELDTIRAASMRHLRLLSLEIGSRRPESLSKIAIIVLPCGQAVGPED